MLQGFKYIYSLSNLEIRRDVTQGRLLILSKLPLNVCVVYGIVAKRVLRGYSPAIRNLPHVTSHLISKPWNKPAGTRGNLHFKIAPGSQGFGMNQEQFSKYSSLLPEHMKVRTQRDRRSWTAM